MEHCGTLGWREAGEFPFLERGRWHGGDLRPARDFIWKDFPRLADFSVGSVVLELQSEQDDRHDVESNVEVRLKFRRRCGLKQFVLAKAYEITQARGKNRQLGVHAVLIDRLVFRHSRIGSLAGNRRPASRQLEPQHSGFCFAMRVRFAQ